MKTVTLEELLEAGCHFGHQVTRQNPKARDFIYEARDGIHIIDLEKTKEGLEEAAAFVKSLAGKPGSTIIIVGNKRQARGVVLDEIKRSLQSLSGFQGKPDVSQVDIGLFTVTNRWIGGILTNFSEVGKNFEKLKDLDRRLQDEEVKSRYTKKEIGGWAKEKAKLDSFYGGIADMVKLPDALFIIDTHSEDLVVREALRMGIPTIGIVDTNADPLLIDYPIPANDDAVGSIKLITSYIVDAWIEGRKKIKNQESQLRQSSDGLTGIMNHEEEKEKNSDKTTKEEVKKVTRESKKKATTKKSKKTEEEKK